jgi:hypothetical protein
MFEEQVDQPVEAAEDTSAEVEGTSADAGDAGLAAAVDQQAAVSDGAAAEAAPEVPDDASARISAAQEHIDNLNMEEERAAAKRVM